MKKLLSTLGYLLVLLIAGIVSAHLTVKLLSLSRDTAVPDLRGKEMIAANDIARKAGLYIRPVGEDYDQQIPEGFIVRQDIPPGNKVKEGRELRVVLSRGPRVREVPDVVGETLREAENRLSEKGLTIDRIIYVHSDSIPRDIIAAQRPEPQEKGSDAVSVIVSTGKYEEEQ